MRNKILILLLVIAVIFLANTHQAYAGAKLKINDKASLDLGFMVNTQLKSTDGQDLDGDGQYDNQASFGLKRGRIRLKAKANDMVSMMYQTEIGSTSGGSGFDMRMLEAYITLTFNNWLKIMAGQTMAPGTRQNVTSTAKLMNICRPNLAFKNLTWGMVAKQGFCGATYSDSAVGISAPIASRDAGATFFGSGELAEDFHLKYYLGLYDGVQVAGKDNMRVAGRVQFNIWDPEPGFWNASTYVGKKETIGIGLGYDTQSAIAFDKTTGKSVDYSMFSFDIFTELFVGEYDTFTGEIGYVLLDLDDAEILQSKSASTGTLSDLSTNSAKQAQGDGYYVQLGYLFGENIQPWIGYEAWESDAADNKGSYDAFRIGLTYFIDGHSANLKAGYEIFNTDAKIGTTQEDNIGTFIVGAYVFY